MRACRAYPCGLRVPASRRVRLTPLEVERARRYHRPLYVALLVDTALGLLVLSLLVFTRLGSWLCAPVDDLSRRRQPSRSRAAAARSRCERAVSWWSRCRRVRSAACLGATGGTGALPRRAGRGRTLTGEATAAGSAGLADRGTGARVSERRLTALQLETEQLLRERRSKAQRPPWLRRHPVGEGGSGRSAPRCRTNLTGSCGASFAPAHSPLGPTRRPSASTRRLCSGSFSR
jgi:hypothetical protein